jgi:site-specific recombinase XerD
MECQKTTIRELISKVTAELIRLKYSELSLHISYEIPWNRFLKYAQSQNEIYFSEDLGERYLCEKYGYPQNFNGGLPDDVKRNVRCIRILGDFAMHGVVLRSRKRKHYLYPDIFINIVNEIIASCSERDYAESSVKKVRETTSVFFWYLDGQGINNFNDIGAKQISGFIASQTGYANATICRIASTLRFIFKFLYENNYTDSDLSALVPSIKRLRKQGIPPTWTKDEIDKLLSSIDRGNPAGKRDYALLLLISSLGIRESDAINLKLDDIHWAESFIQFKQQKTSVVLKLPLLNNVGLAIIDYYKYGRPDTECQNVFVKHLAPFNEFHCMSSIMQKHVTIAGLSTHNKAHGLHTLRHTLASRLLEEKVPVITIADILGHTSIHSTKDYLHIDIKNLIECALDPEEVFVGV